MKTIAKIKSYLRAGVRRALPGNDPDFIVIGAQKAGTTSLHHYLHQHPQLVGSAPKEVEYFDKWINFGRGLDWYRSHFKGFKQFGNRLYFESSPNYIYSSTAPELLRFHYPEIRIIVIFRDPVKRAYSAWRMYHDLFTQGKTYRLTPSHPGGESLVYKHLFKGRESFPTFREALELELRHMANGEDSEPSFIRRGLYMNQVNRYLRQFSRDQILFLGFKDLADSPSETLDQVSAFLEIVPFSDLSLDFTVKNPSKLKERISPEDERFLNSYFETHNKQFFEFLGRRINW